MPEESVESRIEDLAKRTQEHLDDIKDAPPDQQAYYNLDLPNDLKAHLLTYSQEDRIIRASEYREFLEKQKNILVKLSTGISSLDDLIEGIYGGEMIVVGGKTKNGKTLLLQTITANLFKQGHPCLWFSYEVPARQFLSQMPPEIDFLIPNTLETNHLSWIEARILEALVKHECRIVFIDHLHYLIDMARMRNPSLEIGAIVRRLKQIAIKWNIIIFIVSHVRGVEAGMEVTEDHLRDSALTKAEADSTWIITRLFDKQTDEATTKAKVSIRNHRRTGVMGKFVRVRKEGSFFVEDKDDYIESNKRRIRSGIELSFDGDEGN